MSEEHKATLQRLTDAFVSGDDAAIDEVVAEDFVDHDPMPGTSPDREGMRQALDAVVSAFSDRSLAESRMVGEGDYVTEDWVMAGRHTGEIIGIAGTDKDVRIHGIEMWRFAGGRIAERWGVIDVIGMMEQVGALPAMDVHPG